MIFTKCFGYTKLLFFEGFGLKAFSCLAFGILRSQLLMMTAKFCMGIFEALVAVWSMCWIEENAPPVTKTQWMSLGVLTAVIGVGFGTLVAGLCSEPLGYYFAFEAQSCALERFDRTRGIHEL